jgi:glycosyltransferase involved in cell wall biosynthesis
MALGTPVIATHKGAEGLAVRDGETILIADRPEEIAAAVYRVLSDVDFRNQLAAAGRQLVVEQYDWAIIGQQLIEFIETTVQKKVMVHG